MTCPTDYATTVWDHLVADLGQLPVGPVVMATPSFANVPSEVAE